MPELLEFFDITVFVSKDMWYSSRYSTLKSALRTYCRQFQEHRGNAQLPPTHCASPLSLIDVIRWDFSMNARPGNLARNISTPTESITSIKEFGPGRKWFCRRAWEKMVGYKCRRRLTILKIDKEGDLSKSDLVSRVKFRIDVSPTLDRTCG